MKHVPALELMLWIEKYVLTNGYDMLQKALSMSNTLTDVVVKDLEEESERARHLGWKQTGSNTGVIIYRGKTFQQEYSVDIYNRTCTCGKFQELLIPCCHAVKFLTHANLTLPETYCSHIHTVNWFQQMYTVEDDNNDYRSVTTTKALIHDFAHANGIELIGLIPPTVEVQRGRKRKKRIESQSKSTKTRTTNATTVVCPVCQKPGHRRENCRVNNGQQWSM